MGLCKVDSFKMLSVTAIFKGKCLENLSDKGLILLLEYPRVISLLVFSSIISILHDLIDEKQREDFDFLMEEFLFSFEVRPNSFADLNSAERRLVLVADRIARMQQSPIFELDGIGVRIDIGNHKIPVLLQFIGFGEQIRAFIESLDYPLYHTGFLFYLYLNPGNRRGLRHLYRLEIEIGPCPRLTLDVDAADGDLLDQLLVVGIQSIKPMNLVVGRAVGGRVSKNHQRVEFR